MLKGRAVRRHTKNPCNTSAMTPTRHTPTPALRYTAWLGLAQVPRIPYNDSGLASIAQDAPHSSWRGRW